MGWSTQRVDQLAGKEREAASQALTGSLPSKTLHRAVLLSDDASRLVDPFGLATWEELLALLDESGPDELLRQVRAAEAVDPPKAGSGLGPSAATTPPPSTSTSTGGRTSSADVALDSLKDEEQEA